MPKSYIKLQNAIKARVASATHYHTFDPSNASGRRARSQIATIQEEGKTIQAIYMGGGIFLSAYPQYSTTIEFEGNIYHAERYFPIDPEIIDFICVYYCDELSDVQTQVKLSDDLDAPYITSNIGGRKYKFDKMRPSYKGVNKVERKRQDRMVASYGVRIYLLGNREMVDFDRFRVQAIHVRAGKTKTMGVIAYHNTQDWSRSDKVGKLRIFTAQCLDGTEWVRF